MLRSVLDDCCVQLLITIDGERNHSMGSPMDGTPPLSFFPFAVSKVYGQ